MTANKRKCNSPSGLVRTKSATADRIVNKRLAHLRPSPENDRLYSPVRQDDPEIALLAESIRKFGLREPLVITQDRYILSGHRRYAACRLLGRTTVKCRVVSYRRSHNNARFVRDLCEHNRQRVKNIAEIARESIVSDSPGDPYRAVSLKRLSESRVSTPAFCYRHLKRSRRCRLSEAKRPMINAVRELLKRYRKHLPISARRVHYMLLNNPPRMHADREGLYENTRRHYQSLTDLLIRMRLEGLISWGAISDDTRPRNDWGAYPNPQPFIRDHVDRLLKGYYRDLLQSQPNFVSLVVEKNTVADALRGLAMEYCLPMLSGRGYCSGRPRWELANRFRESGKEKLVLLIVSDHDPDGVEIAHSFSRSMAQDFALAGRVHAVKVAVTPEQVRELRLPPGGKAKPGSSTYREFVSRFGESVYECEAIEPDDMLRIVRTAIDSVIDLERYNAEVDREEKDVADLCKLRARMLVAIEMEELDS